VYCSISGYGQSGPRAAEAGHDLNYIGHTGLLALNPGPLDRPVVDRTGLGDAYDIHLQFKKDDTVAAPVDEAEAGIFTAIQEQLGLKLTTAKAPFDVVVIDKVERPSAD